MTPEEIKERLLAGLTEDQKVAVQSPKRRLLIVAGAGAGKTEVMARRIVWWITMNDVPKERTVALTFTEKAAGEMKFRIREKLKTIADPGDDVSLGGMYVGTIHGYCLAKLREYWPDIYHNYDILDEAARSALIFREFRGVLRLDKLQEALNTSQNETVKRFMTGYDQLNEHNLLDVALPDTVPPYRLGDDERAWCAEARLRTDVGDDAVSRAFAESAARYYAYLRCRRFLDFSTSQTEFLRNMARDPDPPHRLSEEPLHVVVDEAQDLNPVQQDIVERLIGSIGSLTVVGDHRQSIYGFRGAKVQIIADLWATFRRADDGETIDLRENFRSTPRIIGIANEWARTISPLGSMITPDMRHGKEDRIDIDPSHVASVRFTTREEEARWIADAIRALVPSDRFGAEHDKRNGKTRGLSLSDIGILVRSATDVRTYMNALENRGIPVVVRAGPDLFSQPEVLFFLGLLAITANIAEFYGSLHNPRSLPARIQNVLGCPPRPDEVIRASADMLRKAGLPLSHEAERRVLRAAEAVRDKITSGSAGAGDFRDEGLQRYLRDSGKPRRVFPQTIYHWLLTEAEIDRWDTGFPRGETALFHLGALSGLVTGLETPGWTSATDYKWQIVGLGQFGSEEGRSPEQPLLVPPDAVTLSTIHGVKGLEFAAVFLADVTAGRFPSSLAKRKAELPMSGDILRQIDADGLSDNDNHDGERRLMYVALTRAERFLFVSRSGKRTSQFIKDLEPIIRHNGGTVTDNPTELLRRIRHAPLEYQRDVQLNTSFSDLRYYLACAHDFYLRKVLGFSPTIDQAFGYGRGLHNLMRAIHGNPRYWAELATDQKRLISELEKLVDQGLFYLRYTTGEPAENMRQKGIRLAAEYVRTFRSELERTVFEPEKAFETVLDPGDDSGGIMVSGAIDVVRHEDPPRVTLIDFKSGDPDSDKYRLDEDEMRLQLGIYALGTKKELEYEPDLGLVRYLDVDGTAERRQLEVSLDAKSLKTAEDTVLGIARAIKNRDFRRGPAKPAADGKHRCRTCDFFGFCGMKVGVGDR
ncbi:UvrD/REP helicase [Sulfobacillus acidophilus DSM 10332]|uniref:DNA 3'-5' helicase n=1 Tax=Sulfobacillus acidophilus (strain ATCC 700253 / DSM 10332 / NAL) TaxID=679936 RepID=G8TVJ6_SULAD|nr:UvrD/REP helicase [Sulfobacillus acidophilus DSM 10332]